MATSASPSTTARRGVAPRTCSIPMKFAYLIEPPFNYRDSDGSVVGCDVELARHVCAALDVGFEPIESEFAELLPGVAGGRWQMTTGLFGTQERRKLASFSRPIWALPDGLLVKKSNPLCLAGYRSVAANRDCVLAVIRDQFQHRAAVEFGVPADRIFIYETYAEAARGVQNGEAGAYASVGRAHTGFIERNPEAELEMVAVPFLEKQPAFGSFAFARTDIDLLRSVDDVLDGFIGSAKHRATMARYGFSNEEIDLLIV